MRANAIILFMALIAAPAFAQIAGFDHHVGKPYDPNALLALVASLAPGRGES